MAETCAKHSFEVAKDVCRQCRNSYCEECLVYSFGPKKPPFCVTCALNAAGVRRTGATPNPRLRKKGIFGRRELVDVVPVREKRFEDVDITLPETLVASTPIRKDTRRTASPELVEAVASAEGGGLTMSSSATSSQPVSMSMSGTAIDDSEVSLADWAASLGEPLLPKSDGPEIAAWPENETAAWPDSSSGKSF